MALSSGSTLQQSDEVASVVATAADGGGGAAVSVVQNEVVAFPSAGSPDRFRVSDTTAPESPIQDAIDYVANQGSGRVVLGSAVVEGGYDPTSVTFDPSVKMEVGAAQKSGWNVKAYGAAGDESVKKDDYAAFQAAHDQAKAYAETIYSGNGRKITLVVPATRDGSQYYLSQPWELTASSLEVQGGGRYSCVVNPHSNFDDTTYESVVRMGKNSEGTNAVTIRDLNIDGRGKEISALKTDITFSGWIQDCTLRSGEYNSSGLGRRVAGLHVYGAKNLWTANCQISTSVGAGVLVDHRGNSGSTIQTGFLGFHDVQITENDYGGIVTRTGAFHIEVQSCSLAVNGDPADGLEAGHQVYIESGSSYHMNGGEVDNGYYGCYTSIGGGAQVKYRGVDFRGLRKQSVIEDASGNTLFQLHNCDFSNTGKDHDPNGSINGDYTSSTKIADVHIRNCFDGQYNIQDNSHNQDTDPDRFYGILNAVGTFSDISSSPPTNFLLVSGNVSPRGGYRATDGSRIKPGETYTNLPGNPHGGIFGKTGEEAAGVGNTPTRADWRIGDVVENTDDNRLFYLKKDGTWFDFSKEQVSFDKGNDGTPDIQGVNQISSQNDPRNIWSVGPGTNELLVDGDPVAYRQEDETITGQWEYEQEIDWTSQINGVGYEGYLQIPVDTPSQTEYILISKLDSNGNNQKLTADLFVGRRTNTSVNNSGHIRVYWNQNGDGSNRNFATETLMDVEGANEVFDVRPVEVTYNSEKWAAVEVSVGFGNIEWRTLQAHHTGNYSLSVIESKSSSNVSNVTFWGDSSEGSLGRQELYAERLQHNASQSHGFTSGFTGSGWLVNTTGPQGKPDKIEAGHMVLRGTLRVRELILEQLRVRKGIQIISAGGGKLEKVEAENFGSPVDADVGEFNAWDIVGVDTAANTLTVDNSTVTPDPNTLVQDQRSLIDGSTGNDDNYTVSSVTDNGDGTSDIVMNESVPDSTADGRVWEATKQRFFFEDPNDTASASGLVAGDRILAQRFDPESQTVVAQIRAVVENRPTTHQINVTVSTNFTAPSTGQDTEGFEFAVVASADGGRQSILVDSPFQPGREVLDGLKSFDDWDNRADFLRMNQGNLDGRYDYTQEAYGMAAGDPDDVWVSADDTKGVRMVDNTQGNQTVRAQLQGPTLTLGDTAHNHIKIDPTALGLQMINDQGTEVARLNGTLLRLGSTGQIQFDPTASPEAKIEGTLQMGSGDIRAQTGGENSLLINGATSFSNGPTETQQDAVTQSFTGVLDSTQTSLLDSSTNPEYTHRLEITVDVASGATDGAEVRVDIDDASANDLAGEQFVVQPGNAATRSVTFVPNSNSVDVSTRAIANGPNTTTVDVSYTLYDMPPLTEMTAVGMRVWKSGSRYITLGDGKIESDEYYFGSGYQLKRKGTDLFWIAPDGTKTQIN